MFNNIFDYTDKLIKILKPKKLIYLAVDGVAPRAKMNQQRSRRFRAAQEAREKSEKESELLKDWKGKGLNIPENKTHHGFDSNTITPGTDFMNRLAQALKIYIAHRLQFDSLWQGLTVIFSDSNVPGEGEHKILEFIRLQRRNFF
jgi:5'-3' exoribonuclease 2